VDFATAIEQLTHRGFPALHEDQVRKEPGEAFGNAIAHGGIKPQPLLEGSKTISEALKQGLVLKS
jgi:hypothetical protein